MSKVLRLRTRLLLCGATLAPASILLFNLHRQEVMREAQAEGAIAWVDPSVLTYGMFWVGLICFLGFVTSLILDLRRMN
jgi:hypothetical protein